MTDILIEITDGVALVTLNRPAQRNALTYAMWNALDPVFGDLGRDPEVKAVVLTGAGADFTAGADIAEFGRIRDDEDQARAYEVAVDLGCDAIARCPKTVIAACKGYTLGGGMHVAMSADFRFAPAAAQFGIPAARLSIVYGVQATRKLMTLVGLTEAKRILYGGHRFGADHAQRFGLIDRLCDDPLAEALSYARDIAATSAPLTIGGAKYILNGHALGGFDPAEAARLIDHAAASGDYREGRAAFAEKRPPAFHGR
ncbi:3-hydroxybutyryl-CoA dehydratase [Frigidibacter albus]|uniref:3-hydroxybutyryl-CoA dehydratase n=1 Tax=Frigidibacter albus TaxID=1465486 RepID=A0A6L8VNR1_9RHOB|nr:enoyl-CoA hydratase-related protein [Frigidibacter albus]MZQ91122.1 3-hydroxybutyryl-CoA dehydratase [Frigidibacter albus]NBE33067.1 3-hydroxybutyryl-CoA dehydratase [Frigidibacter albus]GGH62912.1 3-hydroxybutyryl-CoA dehydratase [Frigidibacter albus]